MAYKTLRSPNLLPTTVIGNLIAGVLAAGLAVAGLFFVAIALIAATLLGSAFALRIWWAIRRVRAQRDEDVIEGSYSVEPSQVERIPADTVTRQSKYPFTK